MSPSTPSNAGPLLERDAEPHEALSRVAETATGELPPTLAWLARAQQGDAAALSRLLVVHGERVRRWLHGRIAKRYRADLDEDDVLQTTYLEAFLQIRRFRPRGRSGGFEAWLTCIARHNLLDALKGLNRDKRPPRDKQIVDAEAAADVLTGAEASPFTPSRIAARGEARQLIHGALQALPPDYREVLMCFDVEGRSARETADLLGRTIGAVYMLRARALEHIRRMLPAESRFCWSTG